MSTKQTTTTTKPKLNLTMDQQVLAKAMQLVKLGQKDNSVTQKLKADKEKLKKSIVELRAKNSELKAKKSPKSEKPSELVKTAKRLDEKIKSGKGEVSLNSLKGAANKLVMSSEPTRSEIQRLVEKASLYLSAMPKPIKASAKVTQKTTT